MDQDKKIIGYRVFDRATERFIEWDGGWYTLAPDEKRGRTTRDYDLHTRAHAYHLLANFLETGMTSDEVDDADLAVVPVYEPEKSPLQKASTELAALLQSLAQRHGVKLEMTREQIERQIGIELMQFGASPEK